MKSCCVMCKCKTRKSNFPECTVLFNVSAHSKEKVRQFTSHGAMTHRMRAMHASNWRCNVVASKHIERVQNY